jgi:cation transport ATPase
MTLTSSSNVNELSTPLLGKRPQHESDDDQECIPRSSLTLAIVYDDDKEESCQKAAEDEKQWTNILSVTSVVLPTLLFFQFGMAFFMSPVDANTGLQQWTMVNYSILVMLLVVTIAALYRQTVQDFQITCLVATIAIMATFLGLLICGQVIPAFLLLLNSMLCMAVFVEVSSIRFLAVFKSKASSLEEDHAYFDKV